MPFLAAVLSWLTSNAVAIGAVAGIATTVVSVEDAYLKSQEIIEQRRRTGAPEDRSRETVEAPTEEERK